MNGQAGKGLKRMFAVMAAVLVVTALVFGGLLYRRTRKMTLSQFRNNALDIARVTASLVDTEAFASLQKGDEDTEAYRRVLSELERVRDSSDVEYVYTIRRNDYGVAVFVVDSDPEEPGLIGEAYSGSPVATRALNGELVADDTPYKDRWGTHISAYAPLFLDGKAVGAAVVDLNYEAVRGEAREVALLVLLLYLATFLVIVLLMVYAGRKIRKYEFWLRKAQEQAEEHERVSARFFAPLSGGPSVPRPEPEQTAAVPAAPAAPVSLAAPASPAASAADDLRSRMEQTGVLNYDEALLFLGNEDLLRMTLKQFHDDIGQGADEIERLLKEGDYENYTIRVHALKSGARVIGASQLSKRAERLEGLGNRVTQA